MEDHHRLNEPPKYEEINSQTQMYQNPNIVYGPPTMLPQQQTNITYIVHQIPLTSLRDQPAQVTCPNCRGFILTKINYKSGVAAWLVSFGLCFFGLVAHFRSATLFDHYQSICNRFY